MTRYIFPLLSPSYVKTPRMAAYIPTYTSSNQRKLSTYAPHAPLQASKVGRCLPKYPLNSLADAASSHVPHFFSLLPILLRANHVSLPPIIRMGLGLVNRICQKRHAIYPCYLLLYMLEYLMQGTSPSFPLRSAERSRLVVCFRGDDIVLRSGENEE